MHGIAYDQVHDEFTVPQQFGQAILTYRGDANGEEAPIRVIQGPNSQLDAPEHLDVDPLHNEIFVSLPDPGPCWCFRARARETSHPYVCFAGRIR